MAKNSPGVRTAKLALVVASLLLLVLMATKYTEYLEKRLEAEVLAKQSTAAEVESGLQAKIDERFQRLEERLASQPPAPAIDPLARDQEVMALRRELQAVQSEREVMDSKIDEIQRQERIDALGGNPPPDPEATLSPQQQAIRRSVPIATVSSFNKEWGFVMLDGGTSRGLAPGVRLGLRRGNDVVALLVVDEVQANSSSANMIKGGPGGRGNAIPQQGDQVIAWPPF